MPVSVVELNFVYDQDLFAQCDLEGENKKLEVQISNKYRISSGDHLAIDMRISLLGQIEGNQAPVGSILVRHVFRVDEISKYAEIEKEKFNVAQNSNLLELIRSIVQSAYNASRGIWSTRFRSTELNNYPLMLIDPVNISPEDSFNMVKKLNL